MVFLLENFFLTDQENTLVPRIATISTFRKPTMIGPYKENKSLIISVLGKELWHILFLMLGNNSNKKNILEMRGRFVFK